MNLLGFTGTQKGMTKQQLAALVDIVRCLPFEETGVVHGDCVGADAQCDELVCRFGVYRVLRPALDERMRAHCERDRPGCIVHPPEPALVRNKKIVKDAYAMLAAPRGAEVRRSGTWSTVRYALSQGRNVHIVWPDGTWTLRTPRGEVIRAAT